MIRRAVLALVLALAGAAVAPQMARADIQDFTVVNNSGTAVWYIYVSPNYSDSWEEDVLGNDVLMPGNELFIRMSGYGSHCWFDIKVEDSNGYAEEFFDVNLCEVAYVYFPSSTQSGSKSGSTGGGQSVTIVNNGNVAVWYIYVSPNYSDSWEEDVLGNDVLMPGYQQTVTLSGYGNHCWFDVKVEDSNGYAQEFYDVDVCGGNTIYFP